MDAKGRVTSRDYEQQILDRQRNQIQPRSPEQVQADRQAQQRIGQEYQQRQAAQQALTERDSRIRAQQQQQQEEVNRPMRESQQREAQRMQQVVEQRSAEYKAGVKALKDDYASRSAQSSRDVQADMATRQWLKERSQLDLAPGRPPTSSTLPAPSPIPINPTKGGEMVHVPNASRSPLPSANSEMSASSRSLLETLNRSGIPTNVREGAGAGIVGVADILLRKAIESGGYSISPSTPEQGERNRQILEDLWKGAGDNLKGLGNAISGGKFDSSNNPFNLIRNPFKKYPRTDPKNDDSRQRTRYAYEIRAFTFYSPNNRIQQQAVSAGGEYSLGEIGYNNPNFSYSPGNTARLHQAIYWDQISGNAPNFTVSHASSQCEPDTIRPDPTYVPPSSDSPLLTQPDGTTPDISAYPPIFTEDDFKPQQKANDDRARQDEADRQNQPNPQQQRQNDNQADKTPDPDPWDKPNPFPAPITPPYPYPLDPPDENTDPDATPRDRLGDTLQRVRDALEQVAPSPGSAPGRTETTINGEPVNARRPSPDPIPVPTETPGTNVTINGEPDPRLNPPLPDTRVNSPTTVKAPVEPRIDPTTGTAPKVEPKPQTQTETPGKCEDPCMQGLHDKADAKAGKDLVVKLFKSCSKPVPEGQTAKPEIDFEEKTIKVPGDEFDAYKHLYERLYALECEQCGDPVAISSVPEWWQARRGSDIPQLVILFAEQFSSGKLGGSRWSLSIPHYNRPKGARPNIPTYNKGNWFGMLKLTDGSKLGVNASSSSECKKVLNRLKIHIPVEYRTKKGKAIKPRIVEDPTADFKECKVTPVRADFYSKGQANLTPDWTINLRQK